MSVVKPQEARFAVNETSEGLKFDIPVPIDWFGLLFFPVWLCAWGFGALSVGRQIVSGDAEALVLLWFTLWMAGGLFILFRWLWLAFGRTLVITETDRIVISRHLFGLRWTREYLSASIYELRWREESRYGRNRRRSAIQFNYGYRTISFAGGLSFAEGERIINLIKQKLPQVAACSSELMDQPH